MNSAVIAVINVFIGVLVVTMQATCLDMRNMRNVMMDRMTEIVVTMISIKETSLQMLYFKHFLVFDRTQSTNQQFQKPVKISLD